MKKTDLVRMMEKAGFVLERHGSRHDIYVRDGVREPIPRHKEINERLAKIIIKKHGLE